MKRTQRLKRVTTKTKKPIIVSGAENNRETTRPSQLLKSISTIRTKAPKILSLPFSNSFSFDKTTILPPEFFRIDALDLAPRLLGKLLRRDNVVLQITEVEAYRPKDSACQGRFRITARTAPAERRGQKTEKPVLLAGPGKIGQALGISTEWSNHPLYSPGKFQNVLQSVDLNETFVLLKRRNGHDLGGLELLDGPDPERILVGPRVGIDYALPEHVSALWRFAVAGSAWISAPKNILRLSSS